MLKSCGAGPSFNGNELMRKILESRNEPARSFVEVVLMFTEDMASVRVICNSSVA